jgi:hypothetical protein
LLAASFPFAGLLPLKIMLACCPLRNGETFVAAQQWISDP